MSLYLIAWTVLCVGFGALIAAQEQRPEGVQAGLASRLLSGLSFGCFVWGLSVLVMTTVERIM